MTELIVVRDSSDGTPLGHLVLSGEPEPCDSAMNAIAGAFSDLSKDESCEWDDILDAAVRAAEGTGCRIEVVYPKEVCV